METERQGSQRQWLSVTEKRPLPIGGRTQGSSYCVCHFSTVILAPPNCSLDNSQPPSDIEDLLS